MPGADFAQTGQSLRRARQGDPVQEPNANNEVDLVRLVKGEVVLEDIGADKFEARSFCGRNLPLGLAEHFGGVIQSDDSLNSRVTWYPPARSERAIEHRA